VLCLGGDASVSRMPPANRMSVISVCDRSPRPFLPAARFERGGLSVLGVVLFDRQTEFDLLAIEGRAMGDVVVDEILEGRVEEGLSDEICQG